MYVAFWIVLALVLYCLLNIWYTARAAAITGTLMTLLAYLFVYNFC